METGVITGCLVFVSDYQSAAFRKKIALQASFRFSWYKIT